MIHQFLLRYVIMKYSAASGPSLQSRGRAGIVEGCIVDTLRGFQILRLYVNLTCQALGTCRDIAGNLAFYQMDTCLSQKVPFDNLWKPSLRARQFCFLFSDFYLDHYIPLASDKSSSEEVTS